ncbi:MAG: double-strand break repair protein AddB [Pseudomonadota bacterium]
MQADPAPCPAAADFARDFAEGLRRRMADRPPQDMARVRLHLNARRTGRAVLEVLESGADAAYLPRISYVSALEEEAARAGLPGWAGGGLRRRFALTALTEAFLRAEPGFGARSDAPALAASLQTLLDELQGAGLSADRLRTLDLGEHAAHWEKASRFLAIVADHWPEHLAQEEHRALDPEARRLAAAQAQAEAWAAAPPADPVIAAGSTGSTPATALLLEAIARLPGGAVVLPGWDPRLPRDVWEALISGAAPEHPHARLAELVHGLGAGPRDPRPWLEGAEAGADAPRPRFLCEALRPAPVTDAWVLRRATLAKQAGPAAARCALIEAPTPREEAAAVAAVLAAEALDGSGRAALVTPDRALARRVTAELARWDLTPDDSAGRPLGLTPPGVLLGLLAARIGRPMTAAALAALLRHPLAGGGGETRAAHARQARALERRALRGGPAEIDWARLRAGLARQAARLPEGFFEWFQRVEAALAPLARPAETAAEAAERHLAASVALSGGADGPEGATLWRDEDGEAARRFAEAFAEAAASAPLGGGAYAALWSALIGRENAPEAARAADPRIRILGTLEARAESADLVVLAGLSEGVWPPAPEPDPWLSRNMRRDLGLAPAEARIGLSAHDFLQAACARRVVFARALRDEGGPTTLSRWLARLKTLLEGVAERPETSEWAAMRRRGEAWLRAAQTLDQGRPQTRAERPSPRPPVEARPRKLPATAVEELIRDPYAVYARRVLRLRRLDPLGRPPDARDRGILLHRIMERFAEATRDWPAERATAAALRDALMAQAEAALAEDAPWAAERRLWLRRLERASAWFAPEEAGRRARGQMPLRVEAEGARDLALPAGPMSLTARADRIDRRADGTLAVYDYKTGAPPSAAEVAAFAKQLHVAAAIAEGGGFADVSAAPAAHLEYIGLTGSGPGGKAQALDLGKMPVGETWEGLGRLLGAYDQASTPYAARLRPKRVRDGGDYDHLSRFGEWSDGREDGG